MKAYPKTSQRQARHGRSREAGATLVVGLVLLLVLTLLGVSGMNTATLEVQMAGNTQFQQDAFQAAETGIDLSISLASNPGAPQPVPPTALGDGSYSTQALKTCVWSADGAPHRTFSPGIVKSWYFDVVATGIGPRNARSTHTQSFYKMGPAAPASCP
jgi:type IV pilus assembly protein PilX